MKKSNIKILLTSAILASGTLFGFTYTNNTSVSAAKHVEHVEKDYSELLKQMVVNDANQIKYLKFPKQHQMTYDKTLSKEAQTQANKMQKYIFAGKNRHLDDKALTKILGKDFAKKFGKSIFIARTWSTKRLNANKTVGYLQDYLFYKKNSKKYNNFITKNFKKAGVGFAYGYNSNNSKYPHESIVYVIAK